MPPTMTTRSASRPAAASRGGGTGGRANRGGGRTRGHFGDQGDGRINGQDGQVGGQGYRVEFFPSNEMKKLETRLWNHPMVGASHAAYTDRFHELARLVPHLVTPEGKRIERYVYGLALQIRGILATTKPKTIQKAMQIAGTLTDEALRNGSIKKNHEKRGGGGKELGENLAGMIL
ncbi:hypothetical protein Tco_1541296 [Tanacetum coccineum]